MPIWGTIMLGNCFAVITALSVTIHTLKSLRRLRISLTQGKTSQRSPLTEHIENTVLTHTSSTYSHLIDCYINTAAIMGLIIVLFVMETARLTPKEQVYAIGSSVLVIGMHVLIICIFCLLLRRYKTIEDKQISPSILDQLTTTYSR